MSCHVIQRHLTNRLPCASTPGLLHFESALLPSHTVVHCSVVDAPRSLCCAMAAAAAGRDDPRPNFLKQQAYHEELPADLTCLAGVIRAEYTSIGESCLAQTPTPSNMACLCGVDVFAAQQHPVCVLVYEAPSVWQSSSSSSC